MNLRMIILIFIGSLVVFSGCGDSKTTVPNVRNVTQDLARKYIANSGLLVGKVTTCNSSMVPNGSVIEQQPAAGTLVDFGTSINLVVSSGPIPIPSALGQAYVVAQNKGYFPVALHLKDSRIAVIMRAGVGHLGITGRLEMIFSSDEGRTWSEPVIVADSPSDDRNPAFGQADDGTLVVAYWRTANYDDQGKYNPNLNMPVNTWVTRSFDGGKTWTPSQEIDVSEIGVGSPYGRILTLADGSLLMNIYGSEVRLPNQVVNEAVNFSYLYRSADRGQTWQRWSAGIKGFNETSVVAKSDGTLLAALRCQADSATYLASSSDGGRTWTQPVLLTPKYMHPSDLVSLPNGEILLTVGNRVGPFGVSGLMSNGGSFDWRKSFEIITDAVSTDCGYPSNIVLGDGSVLTFYYATGSKELPDIGVYLGVGKYWPPNY